MGLRSNTRTKWQNMFKAMSTRFFFAINKKKCIINIDFFLFSFLTEIQFFFFYNNACFFSKKLDDLSVFSLYFVILRHPSGQSQGSPN